MTEQTQSAMRQALVDDDGENKAVRWFLAAYLNPGMTIGVMKTHLKLSGYPLWPDWVERCHPSEHLTKAGAQLWIRHLFSLEQQPADEPVVKWDSDGWGDLLVDSLPDGTLLYTRPAERKFEETSHQPADWVGLMDEEIISTYNEACRECFNGLERVRYHARAIEAKLRDKNCRSEKNT